ncbi:MAG: outer membrane protein assembly factor BamE [Gammaproteobacteria bacterium]|nr:outer membrane protein assembly factor BamE [Gammaproteobacteria bacterium]NIR83846.1 outer membrane protein assembly factor BamE [Gammaproteobacteria bacterium]NIU04146.1 outer membrane protein assembly factor BamE [Gammaproteobacteria bacterium]NIX85420.1 hypothetical protein [Gammaproteobacteria bacterium]
MRDGSIRHGMAGLVVAAVALGATACGTVQIGHEFELAAFTSRVERSATTQDQVREWLGRPSATGVAVEADGRRYDEWTYYYGEGRVPRTGDAKFKILRIRFDRQGLVRSYNWSGSAARGG